MKSQTLAKILEKAVTLAGKGTSPLSIQTVHFIFNDETTELVATNGHIGAVYTLDMTQPEMSGRNITVSVDRIKDLILALKALNNTPVALKQADNKLCLVASGIQAFEVFIADVQFPDWQRAFGFGCDMAIENGEIYANAEYFERLIKTIKPFMYGDKGVSFKYHGPENPVHLTACHEHLKTESGIVSWNAVIMPLRIKP